MPTVIECEEHDEERRAWDDSLNAAVADLLRLATAATRGRSLRRPTHLHVLVRAKLVHTQGGQLFVRTKIPQLDTIHIRLLRPDLRRNHPD